ncbi:MAG: hypothetical protein ACYTG0_43005 [Planctomycetota bacterium]|jgi:hypothetical protein
MATRRTILLFALNEEKDFYHYSVFHDSITDEPIGKTLDAFLQITSIEQQKPDIRTDSREYELFSWQIESFPHESPVSAIPKPGIVIAISKTTEDTNRKAAYLKANLLNLAESRPLITDSVVPSLSQRHHGVASGCRVSGCGVRI